MKGPSTLQVVKLDVHVQAQELVLFASILWVDLPS